MNCKQGDLAIAVRFNTRTILVEVMEPYTGREYAGKLTTKGEWAGPCWMVQVLGKGVRHNGEGSERLNLTPMPDAWLRPLRDPGEDATDETLLWLPAPKPERAVDHKPTHAGYPEAT